MKKNRQRGFTIIEISIATTIFSIVILAAVTAVTTLSKNYTKGITITKTQQAVRQALEAMSQQLQYTTAEFNIPQPVPATEGAGRASVCHLFEYQRKNGRNQNTACPGELFKEVCLGQDLFEVVQVPDAELSGTPLNLNDSTLQRTPYANRCRIIDSDPSEQLPPVRLLPPNVKLESLRINYVEPQPGPGGNVSATTRRDTSRELWTISIRVSFGDEDLFKDADGDDYEKGDDGIWRRKCQAPTRVGGQFCGVTELTTSVERRL